MWNAYRFNNLQRTLALLVIGMAVGCGRTSDRGFVSGTIQTHNGTPLKAASVIAVSSETGKSAYGTTDQSGHFELGVASKGNGIAHGDYNVGVVEDRGDPDNRRPPTIAAKYRDPASSGIKLNVTAGESKELNLKLDPP